MQIVIAVSAAHFGVTEAEVLSQRRSRQVQRARQTAMYLAHAVAGYSIAEISNSFQRDYTVVMHAIRKIELAVDADAEVTNAVSGMRSRVHEIAGAAELTA